MQVAFLLFSWLVYFYLHSLLAATSVKLFIIRVFSIQSARIYRIGYNFFAFTGLTVLLYYQFIIGSPALYTSGFITNGIAYGMMTISVLIITVSIRNYDWKGFVGITGEKSASLVMGGLNKYVRHPLYSGTMLFALGVFICHPYLKNLLLLMLMCFYIAIGIIYEERKLVRLYGAEYKIYQKKVKKMIPYIW